MAENFQDNVKYGGSTLGVSGDAIAIGSTNAGAKSVIFASSDTQGHLAWLPSAARTINLPDAGGTVLLSSQAILSISAGTTRATSGEVVFSNSNGVSFGVNGQTVTGSVAAQSNQTVGLFAVGNTTQNSSTTLDARTISFDGLGIVTAGFSNGSVQISASQSNQSIGFFAVGNTTQNSSTTLDARTVSFDGLGIITVGYSNGSVQLSATQSAQSVGLFAVGNTTQNSSTTLDARTLSFNGLGIVTIGYSNGSVDVSATQSAQTVGLYAVGNTTQNSSTTLDARTLSFDGAGNVSVGYSNGSVVISGGTAAPSPVNFSAGTTSNNLGSVVFSNSNGVTFGLSGSTITASASAQSAGFYAVGNTTQNSSTTLDIRTVSFDGLGAQTVGYSNGSIQLSVPNTSSLSGTGGISISTNGQTISISGPKLTNFEPVPLLNGITTSFAPGIGTWQFEPFYLPAVVSGGRVNRLFSFAATASILRGSTANFSNATTGSRSVSFTYGNSLAVYSLGAGTNSTRLESLWSNTFSVGIAHSVSVASAAGSTLTISNGATLSYVASIDSAGNYTTSSTSQSSTFNGTSSLNSSAVTGAVSNLLAILSGQLVIPVGLNTTLNPGNYWLGQAFSTASTTTGTSADVWSFVGQTAFQGNTAQSNRNWGATATTSGSQEYPGHGFYASVSASPPSPVAFSDIRTISNRLYFNIVNSTI